MTPVRALIGRTFMHPLLDYLLVGGGLALLVFIAAYLQPNRANELIASHGALVIALCNSTHFAASTMRLYTKQGATEQHPLIAGVLPLAMLALVVTGAVWLSGAGRWLVLAYMLWSPYHYAGQAFGLAVIYAMRSGAALTLVERRLLRAACLAPSLHGMLLVLLSNGPPITPSPTLSTIVQHALLPLQLVAFGTPAVLFLASHARGTRPLPAIIMTLVMVQGIWFFPSPSMVPTAAMATIFHGLQYLAIVLVFHVREHAGQGVTTERWLAGGRFYAASAVLGFLLFQCLPLALHALGAGLVEAGMLTVAAINIHHFIVDAFIWKVQRGGNRDVMLSPV